MPALAAGSGEPGRVLVLNAGSSSLKAALVELSRADLDRADTVARIEVSWGADASRAGDRTAGLAAALQELGFETGAAAGPLDAVGYRVVHGGARFTAPTLIDDAVVAGIHAVADLAPLHNGVALETIAAGRALLPGLPHVACFDTAFHATLPPESFRYPVPERWYRDWGIRRFGFHGLSVAWATRRAGELLGRDPADLSLLVAHLGSGCSVTAVHRGRSVDTSMGLTPLEGLMMGTRSGSIDPGVPLYLASRGLLDMDAIGDDLDHASGLLGVSGLSADMRVLQAAADGGNERARLAIGLFARRAAAWLAAMATALPRLDAIVFTGGIGENARHVRRSIVAALGVLGIPPLPEEAKHRAATPAGHPSEVPGDARLDSADTPVAILRVEAREDLVIAAETAALAA